MPARETLYLICYDITSDRRRRQVAQALEGWGSRVQESVFECWLTPGERAELIAALRQLIDETEDKVRQYPLCGKDAGKIRRLGEHPATGPEPDFWLVGGDSPLANQAFMPPRGAAS